MKEYIRTKDKVLEFIPFSGGKDGEICEYRDKSHIYKIGYLDIIAKSDTIEKLCDEFVCLGVPFKTFIIDKNDYEKQGLTLQGYIKYLFTQYSEAKVYGAIWIGKDLISVAKMNEKGELELL